MAVDPAPGPSPFPQPLRPPHEQVRGVVARGDRRSWALPALRELSLADCGIATLGEGEGACSAAGFEGLRALNLEKNNLKEWGEVERLAYFPALERLHLGGNKLKRVRYPREKVAKPGRTGALRAAQALLLAE